MTKRTMLLTVLVLSVSVAGAALAGEETPWFDMKNCAFCKNLMKDPHLLENMTWEHLDISNGILTITTVKPEYKNSYREAMQAMMDLGQKLEQGEVNMKDLKLCGSCQYWGLLEQMGAKFEHVHGRTADITLITSDKPEVVEKIKEYGRRNREELAKWQEAKKEKK